MPEIMPEWPAFAFTQDSSWGRCYQSFLREKYEHSGSESTLAHYRQVLTLFFSEPPKLPDAYTREDCEQFLHLPGRALGRIGSPPSPGTIGNRLSIVNSFYAYAAGYLIIDEENILRPLMTRIAPTTGLHHPQRAQFYRTVTFSDFERLFSVIPMDALGLRDRAILLFLFWTGRRRAEVCSIQWGDLYQSTVIEHGVQRELWMYTFSSKGHSRQKDHAELPRPAKDAIDRYIMATGRMERMERDDALFCTVPGYVGRGGYNPKRPIKPQTVYSMIKRYARKANVDPKITTHSFRHMAAQQRYLAGSDIREIQQFLRHQSLATTDGYLRGLMGTSDPAHLLLLEKFGKF